MQVRISDRDGVPVYVQLVSQIKYLVSSGRLAPGEQLPPVRKLAEQLVVNPNTVARAYRELENEGVVTCRRGAGVFVADGVSPLARREQNRILAERVDVLATEARQMNVDVETLVALVRRRYQLLGEAQHE
jgi:GntR family transcriptional regulator